MKRVLMMVLQGDARSNILCTHGCLMVAPFWIHRLPIARAVVRRGLQWGW